MCGWNGKGVKVSLFSESSRSGGGGEMVEWIEGGRAMIDSD